MNYANHPVARDANGVCTYFDPRYLARRFVLKEFVIYHLSYCKDGEEEIKAKKDFYDKELGQEKHGDVGAYARGGQTDEFLDQTEDLETVLRFDGKLPDVVELLPLALREDEFLKSQEPLVSHMEVAPYNLEHIPLNWIHAVEAARGVPALKGYDKLFNTVDV